MKSGQMKAISQTVAIKQLPDFDSKVIEERDHKGYNLRRDPAHQGYMPHHGSFQFIESVNKSCLFIFSLWYFALTTTQGDKW